MNLYNAIVYNKTLSDVLDFHKWPIRDGLRSFHLDIKDAQCAKKNDG